MKNSVYVEKQPIDKVPLWKKSKPILVRLDVQLTERCNNNCMHCYINRSVNDSEAQKRELSTTEIKEILKEAVSLGCLTLRLTGGEPLLREDFEEIYLFGRKLGLKVLIFTNACLITPHLAELFKRIPPLEDIEISLYGMKESSYESVSRTPGSFELAWGGISLLMEKKVPFWVKGALLPPNRNEIEEFEAWAATALGRDKPPPSYALFFDLHARGDGKKNALIKKLRLSPKEGWRMLSRRKEEYFKEMQEFCARFIGPGQDTLFSCGAGIGSGCIDAYGFFQPCMLLRHPDYAYNLRKGTLKDAMINFFPKIREKKAANPEYLGRCAKCFLKGLCEQCPAKSWLEHGTLDTPVEYLCGVAHTQAKHLGLIQDGQRAWEIQNWKERIEELKGR